MKKLSSLIIPLFVITGCNPRSDETIQHNYHEIMSDRIAWDDVFNQPENNYLVYFYSENCGHCSSIKNEVISYYLTNSERMYFVCTDLGVEFGPQENIVGINNINELHIFGTPFLIRVMEYAISEYYLGASAILEFINN